jgi:hypothetical protein
LDLSYSIESPYDDPEFLDQTPPDQSHRSPIGTGTVIKNLSNSEFLKEAKPLVSAILDKETLACPICNSTPKIMDGQVIGHSHSGDMINSFLCSPTEWNMRCRALKMEPCPACGTGVEYRGDEGFIHAYEDKHQVCVKTFKSEQEWEQHCGDLRCRNFQKCPICGERPTYSTDYGCYHHIHDSELENVDEFLCDREEDWDGACEKMKLEKDSTDLLDKSVEHLKLGRLDASLEYLIKSLKKQRELIRKRRRDEDPTNT